MKSVFAILLIVLFSTVSCTKSDKNTENKASTEAQDKTTMSDQSGNESGVVSGVNFEQLKDGDSVNQEFTVKFNVKGMTVAPAGEMKEGTGHFHLLIDTDLVEAGQVVPTDDKHMHFGKGQLETTLKLAPGTHRLTLLFADGAHKSYGAEWSKTIQVKVK